MTGHFLTAREAAAHLRLSKSLLDKLRLTGDGPAYMKLGSRRIVYEVSDLNAWAERGRHETAPNRLRREPCPAKRRPGQRGLAGPRNAFCWQARTTRVIHLLAAPQASNATAVRLQVPDAGWSPIPVRGKRPVKDGWQLYSASRRATTKSTFGGGCSRRPAIPALPLGDRLPSMSTSAAILT